MTSFIRSLPFLDFIFFSDFGFSTFGVASGVGLLGFVGAVLGLVVVVVVAVVVFVVVVVAVTVEDCVVVVGDEIGFVSFLIVLDDVLRGFGLSEDA